jgi:hypothetical protein
MEEIAQRQWSESANLKHTAQEDIEIQYHPIVTQPSWPLPKWNNNIAANMLQIAAENYTLSE